MITPPCDGCRHAARCKAADLACQALLIFKRVSTAPERWSCAPRQPTAEIFARAHAPIKVAPPVYRKRVVAEDAHATDAR
jgi:hypothetical protein